MLFAEKENELRKLVLFGNFFLCIYKSICRKNQSYVCSIDQQYKYYEDLPKVALSHHQVKTGNL